MAVCHLWRDGPHLPMKYVILKAFHSFCVAAENIGWLKRAREDLPEAADSCHNNCPFLLDAVSGIHFLQTTA